MLFSSWPPTKLAMRGSHILSGSDGTAKTWVVGFGLSTHCCHCMAQMFSVSGILVISYVISLLVFTLRATFVDHPCTVRPRTCIQSSVGATQEFQICHGPLALACYRSLTLAEGFYVLRDLVPTRVTLNRCEVGPNVEGKLDPNEILTRISSRKQFISRSVHGIETS